MMTMPLYQATAVRQGLGCSLRPGGDYLTRRILELTRPDAHQTVLDAGCGPGATLGLLRARGLYNCLGLDRDWPFLSEAKNDTLTVLQADLPRLPLADRTIDMILCECAWNLTPQKNVLAEFSRVLRPHGILAITDIFARSFDAVEGAWPVPCCFAGATDLETVRSLVVDAGFTVTLLEDHSRLLRETAAHFVFAHGSLHGFWLAVTGSTELADQACKASQVTKPGLFLLIAKRNPL